MFLLVFTPGNWYSVIFLLGAGRSNSRTVATVAIYAGLLSDCPPAGSLSGRAGDYFLCDSKTSVAKWPQEALIPTLHKKRKKKDAEKPSVHHSLQGWNLNIPNIWESSSQISLTRVSLQTQHLISWKNSFLSYSASVKTMFRQFSVGEDLILISNKGLDI